MRQLGLGWVMVVISLVLCGPVGCKNDSENSKSAPENSKSRAEKFCDKVEEFNPKKYEGRDVCVKGLNEATAKMKEDGKEAIWDTFLDCALDVESKEGFEECMEMAEKKHQDLK